MGSFVIEEFVGDGVLKKLVPKLVEDGWDDIPTPESMNSDDMNSLNMNQQRKDAPEIRSDLHDRCLL
ncbi:hypothetical protein C5167_004199 [Papaver somniferum]|nr:hypothetical protein C5167_004199 [Papaver somniferum]